MTAGIIEWTGPKRWNPLRGCTRKTAACVNCYAENMAARFSGPGLPFEGFAHYVNSPPPRGEGSGVGAKQKREARWTGKVELIEERLTLPLRWKKPALCFTDTPSDFFHESLPDEVLDRRMAVMALCHDNALADWLGRPNHHFQILTKRWERMRKYMTDPNLWQRVQDVIDYWESEDDCPFGDMHAPLMVNNPFDHISFGVSVHDQPSANDAIPALLATPAEIRFASFEPALGIIDWQSPIYYDATGASHQGFLRNKDESDDYRYFSPKLDLIIAGEESGPGRRQVDPDVFRQTRDQCAASGTHFFLKQMHINGTLVGRPELDGRQHTDLPQAWRALL